MKTVVLKFGGSSLSDNLKLNIVAEKIIEYQKNNKVIVVVSAQGKTTDNLIKEAYELSKNPDERELDVLLSSGEQISISKLAILLKEKGLKVKSLTGWQAGIITSNENQNAKIKTINTNRINKELETENIIIIAGFQGINSNNDITTLGRGGSDTSAVAIAIAIKADKCIIFSDVDGVYTADPKRIENAKKIKELSYKEMLDISNEGAKVLHNRCVEIAQNHNMPIITKSTFNNNIGTKIKSTLDDKVDNKIQNKIEYTKVKSIIKNDENLFITIFKENKNKYENKNKTKNKKKSQKINNEIYLLIKKFLFENIEINNIYNYNIENNSINKITFIIKKCYLNKLKKILDKNQNKIKYEIKEISTLGIVGYGIKNDKNIIKKIIEIIEKYNIDVLNFIITETKISFIFKEKVNDEILKELHSVLIE